MNLTEHRRFLAAQGYLELGMESDALVELDELEEPLRSHPDAGRLRVQILLQAERWRECVEICKDLWDGTSATAAMRLHGAYCLHELKRTEEARDLLLSAGDLLGTDPTFHYNLACYAAVLGDSAEARDRLAAAFDLDPDLIEMSKTDPDLDSVRNLI